MTNECYKILKTLTLEARDDLEKIGLAYTQASYETILFAILIEFAGVENLDKFTVDEFITYLENIDIDHINKIKNDLAHI